MKSKKLLLLTLTLGLFSMINCLALVVTVNNPYHNKGIKLEVRSDNGANVIGKFPKHYHDREKFPDAEGVEAYVEVKRPNLGISSHILEHPSSTFYYSQKESVTYQKKRKNQLSLSSNFGTELIEYTYNIRVRGKNSKIKSIKIDILKVTVNGVDLAHKAGPH